MEAEQFEGAEEERRVQLASKKQVTERVEKYKEVLRTALDGQTGVPDATKRQLVEELLANFEAAVQVNVLVDGRLWEEAPDDDEVEDEAVDLDDLLDDAIGETDRKRRIYPRWILPHVVHTLKAQRKMMKLYSQAVEPQEVLRDPDQERTMRDFTEAAPAMAKEAFQVIKSIDTLQKQAEGLSEVLNMRPSQTSLQIHRDVLPPPAGARIKQPIKRAAARAAAAEDYKPLGKRAKDATGEDQSE